MYNAITTPVPSASERGRVAVGFVNSPAGKGTVFPGGGGKSPPHRDGDGVWRIRPTRHPADRHRADVRRRNCQIKTSDPMRGGDGWKEDAQDPAECHGDRRNGSGLDNEKERPAVEESPE